MCDKSENHASHVLVLADSNLTKVNSGFTYSIVTVNVLRKDGTTVETPKIVWHDEPQGSGDEILARAESGEMAGTDKVNVLDVAVDFLNEILKDGPVWSQEVEKQAKKADISTRNLILAKEKTGMDHFKAEGERFGRTYWFLPGNGPQ